MADRLCPGSAGRRDGPDRAGQRDLCRIGAGGGPDLRHDAGLRRLHHRGAGRRRGGDDGGLRRRTQEPAGSERRHRPGQRVPDSTFCGAGLGAAQLRRRAGAHGSAVLARGCGDDPDRDHYCDAGDQRRPVGLVHGRADADGLFNFRHDALSLATAGTLTMANESGDPPTAAKRVLDPIDRVSEILFGLIMVLTFTGTLSVAEAGREDVRLMLVGALGCNLAWGIIDAVFYLMGCLADRGRGIITLKALRRTADAQRARRLIADALPPLIASVVKPAEFDEIRQRLTQLPEPPRRARLSREDWQGGAGVCLLVFLSTFPVAIPFILLDDAILALRISNAIAILMLFLMGYAFGRLTERNPWAVGLFMVLFGILLVAMTIALGG